MKSIFACLFVCVLFLLGCSSGNTPVVPDNESIGLYSSSSLPVGVSSLFPDGSPAAGQGALGLFQVHIEENSLTGEMTSIRKASLTDVLEVVDITNFLQMAPCSDCAKLESISLDADGNLVVSIGIKHPFEAGDPLKPITGKNRGDLHVFNIEGTIVSDITGTSFTGLCETTAGFTLVNADGYSGYLDGVLDDIYPTDATVHPYILHFDDYTAGNFDASNPMGFDSVTDPPPSGNLVMAMGCDYNYQDYVFSIDGTFDFIYAVGCTYAVSSASKSERFSPEYRVPQHLKKAASEVSVEITRNELMAGSSTSDADIEVRVVDISHGVTVGEGIGEMLSASDVASVSIDIPSILATPAVITSATSGTGLDPADPLIFDFTITNEQTADSGTWFGLAKVSDSYAPEQNTNPLLGSMDGIKRVSPIDNPLTGLFAISEFATYQLFTIDVEFENEPPVVGAVDGCPAAIVGLPFTYWVNDVSDPNTGQTLTYNWDNGQNTPGNYDDGIAVDDNYIELTFTAPGTFTVDVQVDDGAGGVTTSSDPFEVYVMPDGVFVDGDNQTGPWLGTYDDPYPTIQMGIDDMANVLGFVFVLPASTHYEMFALENQTRSIIGFEPDCGLERPVIDIDTAYPYISQSNNSAIGNLIFNYNNSSSGDIFYIRDTTNFTMLNCRFTGNSDGSYPHYVRFNNVDNSLIQQCEFVDIEHTVDPSLGSRHVDILHLTNCDTVTIRNNEFHDIGFPDLGPDSGWSIQYCLWIWNTNSNVTINNNLFYDIYDMSQTTPRTGSDMCNVIDGALLQGSYIYNHNTMDNFNAIARDDADNGFCVGTDSSTTDTFTNNIFKSTHYYTGSGGGHWDSGFRADSTPVHYADYCCVYWGELDPLPTSCNDYSNMIHKGVGSYGMYLPNRQDPDFDYTSGDNFYHPQNSVIATGADDGSEMGCFGGPDGDWTPPSQMYN